MRFLFWSCRRIIFQKNVLLIKHCNIQNTLICIYKFINLPAWWSWSSVEPCIYHFSRHMRLCEDARLMIEFATNGYCHRICISKDNSTQVYKKPDGRPYIVRLLSLLRYPGTKVAVKSEHVMHT